MTCLFASDAKTGRILYLETQGPSQGRGKVVKFLETLKGFGLKPWAIVFDLWSAFPKSVQKVFPGILIQYDHFHVMNQIHRYLKNALLQFRRQLKEAGLKDPQRNLAAQMEASEEYGSLDLAGSLNHRKSDEGLSRNSR